MIGVEVHCGPIHGTILYYTDDLCKRGSSTIVEITRQGTRDYFIIIISYFYDVCHNMFVICSALLDLQTLLSEKVDKHNFPLDMPRELVLQFDNCPENKVSPVHDLSHSYFVITIYIFWIYFNILLFLIY